MAELTYSEKLRDPRWQKKRLEVMQRDGFKCQICGSIDIELHVHHKSYKDNPWESDASELITYCKECHWFVEQSKDVLKSVSDIVRCDALFLFFGISIETEKPVCVFYKVVNPGLVHLLTLNEVGLSNIVDLFKKIKS